VCIDVAHARAAHRVLVNRRELAQTLRSLMLAKGRTLEDTVFGEALNPFLVAPIVDRERVPCGEFTNLLAILPCPRDAHRCFARFALPPARFPQGDAAGFR